MKSRRTELVVLAAVVACFGATGSAKASFLSDLGSASTPVAGFTSFTYNLSLNPDDFGSPGSSQLMSGNYITLYDFSSDLTPGSTVVIPADFSYSILPTGYTSPSFPGTPPADSPSINNITFTYTGSTLLNATSFAVTVTLPGTYTLGSRFGLYGGVAAYMTTSVVSTTSSYFTPVSSTPEPATFALCGGMVGLLGAGRARLRRRRAA